MAPKGADPVWPMSAASGKLTRYRIQMGTGQGGKDPQGSRYKILVPQGCGPKIFWCSKGGVLAPAYKK